MDPTVFSGGCVRDERGSVRFVNAFDFSGIKRFYHVRNKQLSTIRAFHGHMKEAKYVYVARGKILLAFVHLTDAHHPSVSEPVTKMIVSDREPTIVYIPPQSANGFQALEEDTDVLFFSTVTLAESKEDDYRFDPYYWGEDVWKQ